MTLIQTDEAQERVNKLFLAAYNNDFVTVKRLVDSGVDITKKNNIPCYNYLNTVYGAYLNNNYRVAMFLMFKGASFGGNYIMLERKLEMLELLVFFGYPFDALDFLDRSPLWHLVFVTIIHQLPIQLDQVELLLNLGSDVTQKDAQYGLSVALNSEKEAKMLVDKHLNKMVTLFASLINTKPNINCSQKKDQN